MPIRGQNFLPPYGYDSKLNQAAAAGRRDGLSATENIQLGEVNQREAGR